MTEAPGAGVNDKLTTDPPLPPGTPDVDELVGDAVPTPEQERTEQERTEPEDEDVVDDAAPSVEPPD